MNSSSVAILAQGYLGFERTRGCGFCFAGGLGGRRIISHPQASIFAFVCANIVAGSHFLPCCITALSLVVAIFSWVLVGALPTNYYLFGGTWSALPPPPSVLVRPADLVVLLRAATGVRCTDLLARARACGSAPYIITS